MSQLTAYQILTDSLEFIREHWVQGELLTSVGDVCLAGAVSMASDPNQGRSDIKYPINLKLNGPVDDALLALAAALKANEPEYFANAQERAKGFYDRLKEISTEVTNEFSCLNWPSSSLTENPTLAETYLVDYNDEDETTHAKMIALFERALQEVKR